MEWVTVVEAISAGDIHRVPSTVRFKGKHSQATWFPLDIKDLDIDDCRFAVSENGWASNVIDVEWFLKGFLPSTTP
jgi:hypothetical protein